MRKLISLYRVCQKNKFQFVVNIYILLFRKKQFRLSPPEFLLWYKHATVFRHYQEAVFAPEDIQYYNAIASSSDCVLLPAGIRSRKVQWEVPRKSNGWAYGFGRANVWYASEEDSRLQDYLKRLVKQIDEYDGENWNEKYAE